MILKKNITHLNLKTCKFIKILNFKPEDQFHFGNP